jgi:hypothetical protein
VRQHGRFALLVPLVVLLACSGCTTAPDTRCLSSRPAWKLNDDRPTRAKQNAAAERWDGQCTVAGIVGSVASAR